MNEQNHNPAKYISRYLSLRIVVKPTFTKEVDGRIVTVSGKDIRFEEGVFETSDQELIDFLESDKKSFGNVYIRVDENVEDIVKDRGEWMKDLETKEAELKAREEALKVRENQVNSNEEGAKAEVADDGLKNNMAKVDLLAIAEEEGVEGVDEKSKNAEIIEAIRAKRAESNDDLDESDEEDAEKAY